LYPGVEIRRGVTSSTCSRNLRQLPWLDVGVEGPVRVRAPNSVTEVVYVDFRHLGHAHRETDDRRGSRYAAGGRSRGETVRGDVTPGRPASPAPLRYMYALRRRQAAHVNTLHRYGTRYVHPHGVFTSPVSMSHALTHCPRISLTLDPVLK